MAPMGMQQPDIMAGGPQSTMSGGEAMPQDAAAMQGGFQQASPEEQEQYELFVAQGMNLIYDKRLFQSVVGMLEGEGDPIEGLARTAALVVAKVIQSADKAGQKFPGDVLYAAATEIFEDLAELSRRAQIKDYSQD